MLVTACSDLTEPADLLLSTSDLLILPMQVGAPEPAPVSFWVHNDRSTIQRLVHPDAVSAPYLELSFPAGSLLSLNGAPLGGTDSALISVDARPGHYGFTISPAGLAFQESAAPTVKIWYGWYADASIADQSDKYDSANEYAAALEIWLEITVDLWRVSAGSRSDGTDRTAATVEETGQYVLAAPR